MAVFLPQLITKEMGIKDDVKAKYIASSLINILITPFISKSIRQTAWQISDDEMKDERWAEHIDQQFMFGCITTSTQMNQINTNH